MELIAIVKIRLWMEEYGGGYGMLCRYGYALTCHTAQGSEWEDNERANQ